MTGNEIGTMQHRDHQNYPVYRTRKGNYYWRCLDCGEVKFFSNLNKYNCTHNPEWKPTKNGTHIYYSCHICRIRAFRPIQQDMTIPGS